MANANPYQQYQQNAIMGASKGELTLMLYNGAIKFIKQGIKQIEEKNIEGAHHAIIRVQEIISYLNETLNMEYELSSNLSALYVFVKQHLIDANMKKDKVMLGEVLGIIEGLRDAWAQGIKLSAAAVASGQ